MTVMVCARHGRSVEDFDVFEITDPSPRLIRRERERMYRNNINICAKRVNNITVISAPVDTRVLPVTDGLYALDTNITINVPIGLL